MTQRGFLEMVLVIRQVDDRHVVRENLSLHNQRSLSTQAQHSCVCVRVCVCICQSVLGLGLHLERPLAVDHQVVKQIEIPLLRTSARDLKRTREQRKNN